MPTLKPKCFIFTWALYPEGKIEADKHRLPTHYSFGVLGFAYNRKSVECKTESIRFFFDRRKKIIKPKKKKMKTKQEIKNVLRKEYVIN